MKRCPASLFIVHVRSLIGLALLIFLSSSFLGAQISSTYFGMTFNQCEITVAPTRTFSHTLVGCRHILGHH